VDGVLLLLLLLLALLLCLRIDTSQMVVGLRRLCWQ
jgi:hypothetical protein